MATFNMRPRMPFDDVAWEKSDEISDVWKKTLFKEDTLRAVGRFIAKHHMGVPVELSGPTAGAFNAVFKMRFKNGDSAILRIPFPGVVMFPEEKVRDEIAVMRYLNANTSIPVPMILHWGTKEECPCNLGPFIIMEYIEHAFNVTAALRTPGYNCQDRPVLDPDISPDKLDSVYGQIADILLQLSGPSFSRIGSLTETEEDTFEATNRPHTFNMNDIVQLGTYPRSQLPATTFESSSAYYNALADTHLNHLYYQRNDAVDDEIDCRRKYVARHLFRKLARDERLTSENYKRGPFKLWCDDLRPSNIPLNDELRIVGVIDWEFTYAAPVEFTHSPPWWLLLEQPEYWPGGLNEWTEAYEPRLQTFLTPLRRCEQDRISSGSLRPEDTLSEHMERSWLTGDFWVSYAARKSFAFDSVFWIKIDRRFFAEKHDEEMAPVEKRLLLLGQEEKKGIDAFVKRKMEQMKVKELAWEPDEVVDT